MTAERDWRGLLFVAPFVLLYALILIFPLLRGMWLSLSQVDLFVMPFIEGAFECRSQQSFVAQSRRSTEAPKLAAVDREDLIVGHPRRLFAVDHLVSFCECSERVAIIVHHLIGDFDLTLRD